MLDKVDRKQFTHYLQEARCWETDRMRSEATSRRLAWRVALAACVIASLAVTSTTLVSLRPLPVPTVLRVNESTGIVDVLSTLTDGATTYGETVDKYFVQWYVRYREGYSKELTENYYYNVGLMSAEDEQHRYFTLFNPANPESPLNVYGDYAKVNILIKSISFIQPRVALVRYSKEVARGGAAPLITHWAATVSFHYSALPMSESDRAINPLGFQVGGYRNDADTLVIEQGVPRGAPAAPAVERPVALFPTRSVAAAAGVTVPLPVDQESR